MVISPAVLATVFKKVVIVVNVLLNPPNVSVDTTALGSAPELGMANSSKLSSAGASVTAESSGCGAVWNLKDVVTPPVFVTKTCTFAPTRPPFTPLICHRVAANEALRRNAVSVSWYGGFI
jgi:hypothetical protein